LPMPISAIAAITAAIFAYTIMSNSPYLPSASDTNCRMEHA